MELMKILGNELLYLVAAVILGNITGFNLFHIKKEGKDEFWAAGTCFGVFA